MDELKKVKATYNLKRREYFTSKENYVLYKIIGSEITEYVLTLNKVRKLNMVLQLSFINTGLCIVCMSCCFELNSTVKITFADSP
jgi:hypothetical protein